jgi:hypothetical protein
MIGFTAELPADARNLGFEVKLRQNLDFWQKRAPSGRHEFKG